MDVAKFTCPNCNTFIESKRAEQAKRTHCCNVIDFCEYIGVQKIAHILRVPTFTENHA